jgi:metal-responsive CopG/Arc/MetJ family transcriptional regulator
MKPIQIMMDEELLDELDAEEEVRRLGRSALFRKLAAEYIEHRRRKTISSMYRQAYGEHRHGLGKEFDGWENEGRWPSE